MVTSGTNRAVLLAPLLFSIFFAMMIHVASETVALVFQSNIEQTATCSTYANCNPVLRFQLTSFEICCLLMTAHWRPHSTGCADTAGQVCGCYCPLWSKYQPQKDRSFVAIHLILEHTNHPPCPLAMPLYRLQESFCYLGSRISRLGIIDDEITARLAKASAAFGRLTRRLWNDHGIRVGTKVNVYQAAVISTLLYGSESWTLYRRHIRKLNGFHMRCLPTDSPPEMQDRVPDTEVLERCNIQVLRQC